MPARPDGGPCTGVVFVVTGERMLFCYDDRVWEPYLISYVQTHGVHISSLEMDEDVKAERITTVLMSRNNPRLRLPSGFLLGKLEQLSCNMWESYRKLQLPPVTVLAAGASGSRYTTPCLKFELGVGDS
eukprot:6195283-Pleurochrysis_carterae.AAC.1